MIGFLKQSLIKQVFLSLPKAVEHKLVNQLTAIHFYTSLM